MNSSAHETQIEKGSAARKTHLVYISSGLPVSRSGHHDQGSVCKKQNKKRLVVVNDIVWLRLFPCQGLARAGKGWPNPLHTYNPINETTIGTGITAKSVYLPGDQCD